jgi:hypothetical protein
LPALCDVQSRLGPGRGESIHAPRRPPL